GAVETYSIEALMPDGKALQSATSHDLGQNFSKAYDITFTDTDQTIKHVYTTSWGMSWRMLGAMIMVHGDDRGLRIPPKLAPVEAVFVPIIKGADQAPVAKSHELAKELKKAGFKVRVDDRDYSPGWKYSEWEMRGVPVRIEVGPKDLEKQSVMLVRRDKNKGEDGQKSIVPMNELASTLRETLDSIQNSMYAEARHFLLGHTYKVEEQEQFFELCKTRAGMIDIPWCGLPECEAVVKEKTGATTRNTRELQKKGAPCVACGEPATVQAYFAQSY
ncbi:MAG: His/Gly/Thr/Pro-type tRNA ligase C-terminal domain-containing protein, partial [Candidatus Baltobacteraceae bacterium]